MRTATSRFHRCRARAHGLPPRENVVDGLEEVLRLGAAAEPPVGGQGRRNPSFAVLPIAGAQDRGDAIYVTGRRDVGVGIPKQLMGIMLSSNL